MRPPRLRPVSRDMLATDVVFNIGPAIYGAGGGGTCHCDMVVVTDAGAEVSLPLQSSIEELTII